MELTGFGPSHRLKTHNASLPSHHSKPALPMAQTSWPNTLSLSILLLWWVERYSERWCTLKNAWLTKAVPLFQGRMDLRTSGIWKPALQYKRVKQDIHICENYFECPGQWIKGWKKYALGQISFRPSSRVTDITYWGVCCCPLEEYWWQKTVLYVFSLLSTTLAPLVHFDLFYLNLHLKNSSSLSCVFDWIIYLWILKFDPYIFLHHHNSKPLFLWSLK